MKLMTQEIESTLKPLYHYEKSGEKPVAVLKYFDPTGSWTWYAAEAQQREDGDWLFWGAVDGFEFEYGYFTLSELQHAKDSCTGVQALPIERDMYFRPTLLSELRK
jgi:hypothetical protein